MGCVPASVEVGERAERQRLRDDVPKLGLQASLRNRTVLVLGLAYFMLKPARYAILLWGPVIVYEQMPSVGKVGAAIIPTAFELAGLLGPIMIGLASDKLFGARRMPACILSLLALTVSLAFFMGALHSGSVVLVVGVAIVFALFVVFAWGGFRIAVRSSSFFGRLTASGITLWLTMQALINILVVLQWAPVLGVPLPFVSYGGSAMLANVLALGVLVACARDEPEAIAWRRRRAKQGGPSRRFSSVLPDRRRP